MRYEGRRQLQLYLKGIGLQLEEAMLFWKSEFTKKMPVVRLCVISLLCRPPGYSHSVPVISVQHGQCLPLVITQHPIVLC